MLRRRDSQPLALRSPPTPHETHGSIRRDGARVYIVVRVRSRRARVAGNEPARVLPNVDVRMVDETGYPVPPKVVGEIAVRSSGVLEEAREAEGGYFRTGDSGMLDDAGALYVL